MMDALFFASSRRDSYILPVHFGSFIGAIMGLLGWIILGGIAGWIAKTVTGIGKDKGCLFNVIIGVIGSVVGGLLFSWIGKTSVTGFNPWSLFVATVGAIVFLWVASMLGAGKK